MKRFQGFIRRVAEFASFWAIVAVLSALFAFVASAGELSDRYEALQAAGRIDMSNAGLVVAIEPKVLTVQGLADNDRFEVEAIEDVNGEAVGLLVRMDLGDNGRAVAHRRFRRGR